MASMLSAGYIVVHPQLWDFLPKGAHIRYVKKDTGKGLPRCERFCPGGFITNHFTREGKKMLMMGSQYKKEPSRSGYLSFPLAYDEIEEMWKKYDRASFIEMHLVRGSLAEKKSQIESLTTNNAKLNERVDTLTERIRILEEILKAIVGK